MTAVDDTFKKTLKAAARGVIAAQRFNLDSCSKRAYTLDRDVDADTINALDRDLPRTARGEPLVDARIGRIRAMLLRQLAEDPHLGYCQGMNLVAAVFAAATQSQDEAYERFHKFLRGMRGLWLPGFPLLAEASGKFVLLAQECSWYKHLKAHDVEPSMFLPQALMTMLVMWLPMTTCVKCLKQLEHHGLNAMLAMTISVLDHNEERLLQQRTMEGLLQVLTDLHQNSPKSSVLKAAVHEMRQKSHEMRHKERLSQQSMEGFLCEFRKQKDMSKSAQKGSEENLHKHKQTKWWFLKDDLWSQCSMDDRVFNETLPEQISDSDMNESNGFLSSWQFGKEGLLQQQGVNGFLKGLLTLHACSHGR